MPRFATHPVFARDGQALTARYYDDYIASGTRLAGESLDAEGVEALTAMRAIVEAPENWVEFRVEQGQLQYIDNRRFAHSRTGFRDSPGAGIRRHMLRFWNRDEGPPDLEGPGARLTRLARARSDGSPAGLVGSVVRIAPGTRARGAHLIARAAPSSRASRHPSDTRDTWASRARARCGSG